MPYGIDFTAPKGTAIQATGSGRVIKDTRNAGFGNHIVIDHGFGFFYTALVFNPDETAENLKKSGTFIPGIRPGQSTSEYLDYILTRLTVVGSAYLVFVCLLPELLKAKYALPFYLGGTSLLIVVGVTMDTVAQLHSHLLACQYEGLLKKSRFNLKK